jgi:4,5-DOPA dioxygenase extradiol
MTPLPTLFISHGSPMHALAQGRPAALWAALGKRLPTPRAVLVVSAHWETELPMLASSARPETLHDFGGFPPELYRLRYPAPGAPDVAQRAQQLLQAAGVPASGNGCRGLDHGVWVPLRHMYPQADVPVTALSVQPSLDAAHHLRLGQTLAPLAAEGVLLLGSGHMTHNLGEWIANARRRHLQPGDDPPLPYVREFSDWVDTQLRADTPQAMAALAQWETAAPHARRAHPTVEHFLPLLFAYGAAGAAPQVERLEAGVDGGVLAMDSYLFSPRT